MDIIDDNVLMMGHRDYEIDTLAAALVALEEKVGKLENYLKSTRIYTDKCDKIFIEMIPEIDDFGRADELEPQELDDIAVSMHKVDIFTFTQRLMSGYIGMIINHSNSFECNEYWC